MKTLMHFILTLAVAAIAATAAGAQEIYSYDAAGRLARVVFDDRTTIDYTYDANGNILSMRSGVSSVEDETHQREGIIVSASPNPVTDRLRIGVEIDGASRVAIDILSLDGAVAAAISDWRRVERKGSVEWDASELAAGSYVVRVRAVGEDGSTLTRTTNITVVR